MRLVFRCHEDDRESFLDEGNEAVLALPGRIGDGWNIAQLEELEASLKSRGDIDPAPQETDA